jgi:hypothetical protein
MRTSLNNIKELEAYHEGKLIPQEALLAEARLLSNPLMRMNFFFQKKAYAIVQLYHRKKLKEEAQAVHEHLFTDPAKGEFQQKIYQLFPFRDK